MGRARFPVRFRGSAGPGAAALLVRILRTTGREPQGSGRLDVLRDRMDITLNCALAVALAGELREQREELARRWLDRIAARVAVQPELILPESEVLDHLPLLVEGIADYLADPADEISADVPVIATAIELGKLRHAQGFGAHEILKEYEILGGVLFAFLVRTVERIDQPCGRSDLLACSHRLFRAIAVIQQVTTAQYLALADERVREREERLRGFNRTVSHELKNRIGAVVGAAQMLGEDWIRDDPEKFSRFISIVVENAGAMQAVLQDLLALSRTDTDTRRQRNVLLRDAVAEVVRQLREFAAEHRVSVRVDPALPEVEVNASVIELCLSNYLSNAIKYADPEAAERWVEVAGELRNEERGELVVTVRDNGRGVPPQQRDSLFERFFRADSAVERGIEGTGLGLSIVREAVEALGGRAWAEFGGERGSTFCLSLPLLPPGAKEPVAG